MRRFLLAVAICALPFTARAQDSAALVADTLLVTADERLVASGNVQAFFEGTVLSAAQVSYDRRADRLLVEGPILIREADGTVLTAQRAELDPQLEQGLLRGARLVLERQLQLAASRIDRVDRLTALTGAAATSCQVCPGRAPLWEIRAEQVIHDEEAELLYFEGARFLIRGVPILWFPRLRLPDPGNERATGLLFPRLRVSETLGVGVELPYFIEIGPHRDLTLRPYLSSETLTLGARYRQALLDGDIELNGALSRDDLIPDRTRGYLVAEGAFEFGEVDLAFDATLASDDDYLEDYGLLSGKVVESRLRLARTDEAALLEGGLSQFRVLERDDGDAPVPSVLGDLSWERREGLAGGTLTLGAGLDTMLRRDEGTAGEGRDTTRAGAFAGWQRGSVLGWGLVVGTEARLAADSFWIEDDPAIDGPFLRIAPAAAVTLRWPLLRRGPGGMADLLEPVASLGWSDAFGEEPPDEDSRLAELDEANLLGLSRFPGEDAVEDGGRLSLGVNWTRTAPGVASTLSFGRVLRTEAQEVSSVSGLSGETSHWLVAGEVELDEGLSLQARTLLGDGLEPGKTEARAEWDSGLISLEAGYARIPADLFEDRDELAEELSFATELRPSEHWTLRTEARYDLERDEARRLGLGIAWRNECVEVDVSLARGYTSADEEPSTEFGLSVDLLGFSAGPRVTPAACRG